MKNFEKFKTAKEREIAFNEWCSKTKYDHECEDAMSCNECQFAWLDLEAEEEKPLPCPLCGARMGVSGTLLKCTGCGLGVLYGLTTNDVTRAFNRVAKAVMESGKEGDKRCLSLTSTTKKGITRP